MLIRITGWRVHIRFTERILRPCVNVWVVHLNMAEKLAGPPAHKFALGDKFRPLHFARAPRSARLRTAGITPSLLVTLASVQNCRHGWDSRPTCDVAPPIPTQYVSKF